MPTRHASRRGSPEGRVCSEVEDRKRPATSEMHPPQDTHCVGERRVASAPARGAAGEESLELGTPSSSGQAQSWWCSSKAVSMADLYIMVNGLDKPQAELDTEFRQPDGP
eukprot:TRINITY_DN27550_c0_g1_i1.p1 TRINITY_DN27550_c0_g1~~TRINITY_DN27550_c0_g1_i1.p1  ORF type:complete len:110 (-),score=10.07 TRINITY_DN27550_c0_g1_i1:109-438(-)